MLYFLLGIFCFEARAETTVYKLNSGGMSVRVYKDGALSRFAHNHVVEAVAWQGSASFDPAKPENCKINITMPVNKLRVDAPRARNRIKEKGYDSLIGDDDRKKIKSNILATNQLHATAYPNINFNSTSCKKDGEKYTINGKFTLRGVSKNIAVKGASIKLNDGKIHIRGKFKIKATDYGFQPYKAAAGAIKNKNEMKVFFGLKGAKN